MSIAEDERWILAGGGAGEKHSAREGKGIRPSGGGGVSSAVELLPLGCL